MAISSRCSACSCDVMIAGGEGVIKIINLMSNYNAVCTYHSKLESEVFVDFLEGMRKGSVIVDETTVCDIKKTQHV